MSIQFLRCSAWRHLAEHCAESLRKGMRVVVTGRLRQREYEPPDGGKRTVYEIDAADVGPSLTVGHRQGSQDSPGQASHPADGEDRWATVPAAGPTGAGDEPPF